MSKQDSTLSLGTILDGDYQGAAFTFDLDLLRSGRLLLQAGSGAGKSETVRKLVTDTIAHIPSLILDPEGEYAPLRKQLPFLLVGEGGEIPAEPETVDEVVRLVLETGVSVIFDLFGLKPKLRSEYAGLLFTALDEAPKHLRRDMLLIVDEAHIFAPQDVKQRSESPSAEPFAAMASRGRKRGYAVIAATQRIALLDNNIAGLCENILFGRTGLIDQARTASLLNVTGAEGRAFRKSIGSLNDGDFYAYGRAFGLNDLTLMHVERVPGPTLKQLAGGKGRPRSTPPTPESLLALLPKFEALPKQVEEKAATERDLRRELEASQKRVREMERTLIVERSRASAAKPAPAASAVKAAPPVSRIDKEKLRMLSKKLHTLGQSLAELSAAAVEAEARNARAAELLDELRKLLAPQPAVGRALKKVADAKDVAVEILQPFTMEIPADELKAKYPVPAEAASLPSPAPVPASDGKLPGNQAKLLNAIAWLEDSGLPTTNNFIAVLSDFSPKSSHFANLRGALRSAGMVDYRNGLTVLTEEGRRTSTHSDVPLTVHALQEAVMAKLSGGAAKLLRVLLAAYPESMSNDDLAAATGYSVTSSNFANLRGELKTLGLVEYPAKGMTVATSILFPEI